MGLNIKVSSTIQGISAEQGTSLIQQYGSSLIYSLANVFPAINSITPGASQLVLAASQSGAMVTNTGATQLCVYKLPSASSGLNFTFAVTDADGMQINAGASQTIQNAADGSTLGGWVGCTTLGNAITLAAVGSTQWQAIASVGTWTVLT